MRMIVCFLWVVLGSVSFGQTLKEAKADFDFQARALRENFLKYREYQVEVLSEKIRDGEGDLALVYRSRLEKTHKAWLAWAELQARDLIAAEPVGKQEALLYISKAWLYEQKSRELGSAVGGPENANQPVIDDTRVNIGPIEKGFEPYAGAIGKTNGLFALQWMDEKSVRGGFASYDLERTFRVFGELTEEGVIEFLFVVSGEDEGIEVRMEKGVSEGRTFWKGSAAVLGDVAMAKVEVAQEEGDEADVVYEGVSGRARLAIDLGWKPSGQVQGAWAEVGSGGAGDLRGVSYAPGYLYLDRWEDGDSDQEAATVPTMWFLKKPAADSEEWVGKAIYLNGYEESLRFKK